MDGISSFRTSGSIICSSVFCLTGSSGAKIKSYPIKIINERTTANSKFFLIIHYNDTLTMI